MWVRMDRNSKVVCHGASTISALLLWPQNGCESEWIERNSKVVCHGASTISALLLWPQNEGSHKHKTSQWRRTCSMHFSFLQAVTAAVGALSPNHKHHFQTASMMWATGGWSKPTKLRLQFVAVKQNRKYCNGVRRKLSVFVKLWEVCLFVCLQQLWLLSDHSRASFLNTKLQVMWTYRQVLRR